MLIGLNKIQYELNNLKEIPFILFTGARGTGKTSLAKYIAQIKNKQLYFLTGNTLNQKKLFNTLIKLKEGDIILIDEIHRVKPEVQEILYQPLNDNCLPLTTVTGENVVIELPKFSVLATTTKTSLLSKPLISRFNLIFQIPHYSIKQLAEIIHSKFDNIILEDCLKIANNITTPREAINLAQRVNNFELSIDESLKFIGYEYGLSNFERDYLKVLQCSKKLSLTSLTFALQLDKDEVYRIEDKLIKKELLNISSKGRELSFKGKEFMEEIKSKHEYYI